MKSDAKIILNLEELRPIAAVEGGQAFAEGAKRTKLLRDSAWAALHSAKEASDAGEMAACEVARAAAAAAGAAYLHPLVSSCRSATCELRQVNQPVSTERAVSYGRLQPVFDNRDICVVSR
ncbi:hypothetical protein [Paramesorhizobium deserti]|uniref:hypothetical protein n=1 Tax=Paramesorhizobium deserti TaxID=1494590 RepID=UPI0019106C18|nr:hypothetical protein [Paramesorhizobium deserti]